MNRLLYVVNYNYLSYPLYKNLVEILGGRYEHILLLMDEPFIDQNLDEFDISIFSSVHRVRIQDSQRFRQIVKSKKYFKSAYYFTKSLLSLKKKIIHTIASIDPDLIVSTTDMTFGINVISSYSNSKKIRIAVFQPAFIDSFPMDFKGRLKNRILYLFFNRVFRIPLFNRQEAWGNEIAGAVKFLWGPKFLEYFRSHENVRIVGNPMLKGLLNARSRLLTDLKETSSVHSGKITITICTEAFKSNLDGTQMLNIYRQTMRLLPEYDFIVKVHPRDDIRYYLDYFEKSDLHNVRVLNDISIIDVLLVSNVQVSVNSFSSVEAIVLNVPVVLVNRNLVMLPNHFSSSIVLEASDARDLVQKIQVALSEEYRERFTTNRLKYINEVFGLSEIAEIESKIRDVIGELIVENR